MPYGPEQAHALTLALHGAALRLLTGAPGTLAAAGLDDLDSFARAAPAAEDPEGREPKEEEEA
ncbi:hypothetical protein [Streptomyces sp. NBC_00503]|uniref:hypothetical protein n=1 Tax=Streptomyces sp. NBC_00503 TaxID=2903659 RepID=UPI002E8171BF|nr:hypothetical protein [Streptomyces sp. NBC_00503]WUD79937.1 hypothetical protein OG490_04800 [Streptomyces sp. NBC_00503]